ATPAELALRRQGVLASMVYPSLSYLANPDANPLLQAIFRLRHRLAGAISSTLPEPEASTLQATVLGFRSTVSKQQQQALIDTGTVHLVVISGFKLSLLAMMLEAVSQLVLRRLTAGTAARVLAALLVLAAIGGYTVLTGATPSSLRAALMAGVVVLAALAGRPADRLTTLALAVLLILFVNPFELGDGGFELSALSVLGITLLAEGLAARLAALARPLQMAARNVRLPAGVASSAGLAGQAVGEAAAVSLAATLFDLPVLANNFHVVSLVSPLANLVGMPLLGPLMLFGAAGSALGVLFAPAGALLLWIAWAFTWCLEWVIRVADLVPHAAAPVGSMPGPLVLGYYAALLVATCRITRARPAERETPKRVLAARWRWMAAPGAALVGLALVLPAARRPANSTRVAFLAVAGEASLVQTANGRNILINGGLNGLETERQLGAFLAPWDRTFALALATTTRADRVGGLADIGARYHLLGLVEPDAAKPSGTFTRLRQSAPRVQISAGQALDVGGGATLELLYPPQARVASSAQADALTMVWRLRLGASSVLFAGRLPVSDWPALGPVHDDVVESAVEPPPGPLWVRPVTATPPPAGRALVDLGENGTWSLRLNSTGITLE
ncbi:MAG: ComEC/Rec2 family competence protein, partial [Chloroflexota bacterium]